MNRAERRRQDPRYNVRCPSDPGHRVFVHVNTEDATQAVWNCIQCETVGDVAIGRKGRLHAINPEPMTDYDRIAWARLLGGLLASQGAA